MYVNYSRRVLVDTEDLLDAADVAEVLGLARPSSVSTYRLRYGDFPDPVIEKQSKKCVLWLRSDIDAWASGRRRS